MLPGQAWEKPPEQQDKHQGAETRQTGAVPADGFAPPGYRVVHKGTPGRGRPLGVDGSTSLAHAVVALEMAQGTGWSLGPHF